MRALAALVLRTSWPRAHLLDISLPVPRAEQTFMEKGLANVSIAREAVQGWEYESHIVALQITVASAIQASSPSGSKTN